MDYNDPSRRQYTQNPYNAQQAQGSAPAGDQYGAASGSVERFRQSSSFLQQSPSTVPSTGRTTGDTGVYPFQQGSQYAAPSASVQTMQYGTDLQTASDPRSQDTQSQYPQYGSHAMYGIAQSSTQQATQSPYDPVSRYVQRPSTASETLASQFGASHTNTQYYLGQPLPSATAAELAAPQLPSQYAQPAYAAAGPSSSYTSAGMIDPTPPSGYSSYAAAASQYGTGSSAHSVDPASSNYQHNIRTIFSAVRDGTMRDLGGVLLDISHYLLGHAEHLGAGYTRDEDSLHDERIRMWDQFNRAWLTTLTRQYESTQEWLRSGGRDTPNIMSQQTLEHLSRELVRLCDSVEKYGLVDYQMGVAEEEIMDLLLQCLSLLDPESAAPAVESSSTARDR